MDIQARFDNGTTETRPANCPALASYDPTDLHPSQFTKADVVPARPEPVVGFQHSSRRVYTHALAAWREGDALVWRITGQDPITKALTGEWTRCYVESAHEQIERLTRERDAERASAKTYYETFVLVKAARDAEKARANAAEKERDEARECARRLAALDFNETPSLHDAALVASWGGAAR